MEMLNHERRTGIGHIKKSLEAINLTLSEAKGGWKTLMWVAGASSAVTSFFIGLYSFFNGR
jgi:predicted secreted protein